MSPDAIDQLRDMLEEEKEECCEVYPENWDTLVCWLRICGLWRYASMGGLLGLDWQQVHAKLSLIREFEPLVINADVLQGIEYIASIATEELRKQ